MGPIEKKNTAEVTLNENIFSIIFILVVNWQNEQKKPFTCSPVCLVSFFVMYLFIFNNPFSPFLLLLLLHCSGLNLNNSSNKLKSNALFSFSVASRRQNVLYPGRSVLLPNGENFLVLSCTALKLREFVRAAPSTFSNYFKILLSIWRLVNLVAKFF